MIPTPANPDDIKQAAHRATALAVDAPREEVHFDPQVGERALVECRAALLALEPTQVSTPFCDPIQAGGVALSLAALVRSPRYADAFAQMPPVAMAGASAETLTTFAHALFYLETRKRTKTATTPTVRLSPAVRRQALALREKMAGVLDYVFMREPLMRVEIADIRARGRYADLAANLGRLASHYSTRQSDLAKDSLHYDPEDENRARALSKEILESLAAPKDKVLDDLRNRAFTCLMLTYNRLRLAGELIYMQSPIDLERFPPLRGAVMALARRPRAAETPSRSNDAPPPSPVTSSEGEAASGDPPDNLSEP